MSFWIIVIAVWLAPAVFVGMLLLGHVRRENSESDGAAELPVTDTPGE